MKKILIKSPKILTMAGAEEVTQGDILINGDRIEAIGVVDGSLVNEAEVEVIDGSNCVALPGLVNTHTHAAMTLLRSYADDMPLTPWLEEKIWPAEDNLTDEYVYAGSKLAILEMIKSGTTTFADMYFFMDETAKAADESGIRAHLSRGLVSFTDNNFKNLKENEALIERWHKKGEGRINCWIGPHAPYTCPPDYLAEVIKTAERLDTGIHIHLAETKSEFDNISEQYGKSPIAHIESTGLFSRPTIAAHCVWLSEEDRQLLAKHNVGVAHNPSSNMKLASGIAPVHELLELGVNVGIGTDGASSNNSLNMFKEMFVASVLAKVSSLEATRLSAYQVLQMATILGAKALRMDDEIGSLEVGKKADIILVDLNKPNLCPGHNVIADLVYSANGSEVKTSIINGRVVMKDYQILTMNEAEVMTEAKKSAQAICK